MIAAERHGSVALLTVDRPAVRNALDTGTCRSLTSSVASALADGVRAMVITGAGDHFCAGADLTGVEGAEFRAALREALLAVVDAPVAVLAAVHGAALGAGTQLAAACDLRVATADSRFGIPAARLGVMVDDWTVRRLVRLAGDGPARAMLLTAEELSGADAHRLGLVQRIGDLGDALAWGEEIAKLAPLTIAGHKLIANRLEHDAEARADPDVEDAIARAWSSADLAEGMAAFRDRRPPEFTGR